MNRIRRALIFSSSERYVVLSVNFATVAAVSRILTPGEVGVSVIGMAVAGIAMSLREFASGSYIIQRRDLRPEDVRSAFTVMLVLTAFIVTVLLAAAPHLARVYGEPGLTSYFQVICACLVLELIWSQIVTLLRREIAFLKVAAINLACAFSASGLTVILASQGFSYMSFAWGWLAGAAAASLLALCLRPQLSVLLPGFANWREMVAFGAYNGGNVMLYRLFEQTPYLLLARVVSPDAAALFSRGMMISQMPDKLALGGVASVALPAFAAAARDGRCLRELYLRSLTWITGLLWPAHLVLGLLAYPVVDLLLGPQWHASAQLIQLFAVASLFSFSFELNYPILVAVGAFRQIFLRGLIIFPSAAILMAVAAIVGGLKLTALSLVVVVPLNALVALYFVRRQLGIDWRSIAIALRKSVLVSLLSALGPTIVVLGSGTFELSLAQGAFCIALAAAGWFGGIWFTDHPLAAELPRFVATLPGPWSRQELVEGAGPSPLPR